MAQDDRATYDRALRLARHSAYDPGEFVGQESFMRASEIVALARRAGVAPGVQVLDLCCGVAGPGRFITETLRCGYLGVDASAAAIDIARERGSELDCRFEVSQVPPVPHGPFDVVLLLETMLAFRDKRPLLREIAAALRPGGRFGCTLEEGPPLTGDERALMPHADTVWLTPLAELLADLERVGLPVTWQAECTGAHLAMVGSLTDAFIADSPAIAALIGQRALDELVTSHQLWSHWMRQGRVRKFALIAQKAPVP